MKQLYICEKCGKQFEDYEDAYNCEKNHITEFSGRLEPELQARMTYHPGCPAPDKLIFATDHYDWKTETIVLDPVLWKYKLVGPVPEQETKEIMAEYEQRKAKEAKWLADFNAEKEHEKAETAQE